MPAIAAFAPATLQAVCDVLGNTADGLSGSDIGKILRGCRIDDPSPSATKRHRLFDALHLRQDRDGVGTHVAAFIHAAMEPVRYAHHRPLFDERRTRLNLVLAFAGFTLGEDGKLRHAAIARTISDAEARAGRLRAELQRRRVHPDVLTSCRAEVLADNYFHAVLEASKSVAAKMRALTGLTTDGTELVDNALGRANGNPPRLAFNSLRTPTERSEHLGMVNLLKGVFGAFRNPVAHEPKATWNLDEADALDLLTLVSLLHRRLDAAVRVPSP